MDLYMYNFDHQCTHLYIDVHICTLVDTTEPKDLSTWGFYIVQVEDTNGRRKQNRIEQANHGRSRRATIGTDGRLTVSVAR